MVFFVCVRSVRKMCVVGVFGGCVFVCVCVRCVWVWVLLGFLFSGMGVGLLLACFVSVLWFFVCRCCVFLVSWAAFCGGLCVSVLCFVSFFVLSGLVVRYECVFVEAGFV